MAAKRIDRKIDMETGNVTFTIVGTDETLVTNPADYVGHPAAEIKEYLGVVGWRMLLHAVNNKVGDSASSPNDDAMTQLVATWNQLKEGTWNTRGSGSGPRVTVLAEAMFEAQTGDLTLDQIVDRLDAMSKEQRRPFRQSMRR